MRKHNSNAMGNYRFENGIFSIVLLLRLFILNSQLVELRRVCNKQCNFWVMCNNRYEISVITTYVLVWNVCLITALL